MHYWIHGPAGSGKSTLAAQIARRGRTAAHDNVSESALLSLLSDNDLDTVILQMDTVPEWLPVRLREIGSGAVVARDGRTGTPFRVDVKTRLIVFAPQAPELWQSPVLQAALHRRGILRVMPIASARVAHNVGSL